MTSPEQLDALLVELEAAELFAFDTETTSLDSMQAELVGLSFCTEPGRACYIPLGHDYPGAADQLDRDKVLARLKPVLEDPGSHKVGQHIKYDMNVLSLYGIRVRGVAFDTMLESYVLNSTGSRHDMDSLALKYLGMKTTKYEDICRQRCETDQFQPGRNRNCEPLRGRGRRHYPAPAPAPVARTAAGAQAGRGARKTSKCHWSRCWRAWSRKAS